MTISVANVLTTDTFGSWLTRTNTLATIASQNAVTVDATAGGSLSTGNAYVNGFFGANTVVAFTGIAGGSLAAGNTLNLLTNTAFVFSGANVVSFRANSSFSNVIITTNSVSISAVNGNTLISGNFLNVNASTTNVTSTSLNANSNVTVTGNTTLKANSSFNILSVTGNSSVAVLLANTTNTTFVGNVTVANSVIVNNLANVNQLNVFGAVTSNIAGNLRVEGSVSIGGTFSYTGSANGDLIPASNNFFRLGNSSLRWADLWSNNVYATTANITSLIVTGNTNFANSLIPSANVTQNVGSSALYWNQAFVANTNSNNVIVSNNVFVPAGTAAAPTYTFTGNTDTGVFRPATATVGIAAAGNQRLSVNNTTVAVSAAITVSNTASVTGNATFSNTIAVTGNATLSNTLTVAGVTTLSSNVATPATLILNNIAHQFANSFTFNNSTATANVDTVSASLYRSYEYTVQLSDTTTSPARYQLTKLLLVHDGTTPYLTEYGIIFNSSQMGLFDAIINAGNIALQLTPTSANVVVRFVRTGIV